MSMLVVATSLALTNIGMVSAETTMKTSVDKRALDAIANKQTEAANKMILALNEYKKTLEKHQFANANTDRRMMENFNTIEDKINGIISLHRNPGITPTGVSESSSDATSKIIQVSKFKSSSSGQSDTTRVIYKITAGDERLEGAKVTVSSDVDEMKNTVNLQSHRSTVHSVVMKVKDPNSVNVLIQP